ncbi:MAG: hypothetical protein HY903_05045 [Deltaproteobacteria bacterium]|nr:hypothetical protein [Deltaproteobacteria bacterium]
MLLGAGAADAEVAKPKLVVMPLQLSSLPDGLHAVFGELVTEAIRGLGEHQVLGKSDLDALLGAQNAATSAGCDDVACAAEIGGALGAEFLVAGRIAKLGNNLVIVLKLINAQERRVLNSVKHKASDSPDGYDRALGEAVQTLFGRRAPDGAQPASVPDDPLRARIKHRDWARYQYYVSTTGRDVTLSDWVRAKNHESTVLLVGELVAGTIFALAVPLFILERQNHPDDKKPSVVLAISTVALGTLLGIDFVNVGGVEVADE